MQDDNSVIGGLLDELAGMPRLSSVSNVTLDSLHNFVLDNVPYGVVRPENLRFGNIDRDGPGFKPLSTKPPLYWYFAGIPYTVVKAIRIRYAYVPGGEGNNQTGTRTDALLIGITGAVPPPAPPPPQPQPQARAKPAPLTLQQLVQKQLASRPNYLIQQSSPRDFDKLVLSLFDDGGNGAPALGDVIGAQALNVEFTGPASKNNSSNPLSYADGVSILNDVSRLEELVYWYFGGKPGRVTKAMRIPSLIAGRQLLIGFQGSPGGY